MATLIIDRFDGKKHYEQSYVLAAADVSGKTVLNTLLFIKQTQDPTLNFTASCRCAICGACGVRVNGHAILACDTKMDDLIATYGSDTLRIAPLANFRVISDLVVDWEPAMENLRKIHPGMVAKSEFSVKEGCRQTQAEFDRIRSSGTVSSAAAAPPSATSLLQTTGTIWSLLSSHMLGVPPTTRVARIRWCTASPQWPAAFGTACIARNVPTAAPRASVPLMILRACAPGLWQKA